ncbi:MAG TPA: alcohol dehydrogenase catalytic domain-containing protein [Candidatus Limnocylindrales bacterium]|nr:alcohol dehydrogenase catalytic domain-containing protein [Candidatus Limnocylindrales bacterium]
MKVARLYSATDIRVEDIERPVPGPGQALVRTRACGICTGDIMGWYLERRAPLVFGHEPAGDIIALGEGAADVVATDPDGSVRAAGYAVGDRVFVHHHAPCGVCRQCRRGRHVHCATWRRTNLVPGGMAEFFLVGAENLATDTLRLPDTMSYAAASLVEPAACAVKSLRRADLIRGDTMLVVGLGIMGMLHVVLGKAAGLRVVGADLVDFRLRRALELGADDVIDVRRTTLADGMLAMGSGEKADAVICGPGSIEAMEASIEAVAPGGRVVLFTTSKPADVLPVKPYRIYFDEISIVPSYSCGPDDTRAAFDAIESGVIREQDLITHRFGLASIREAFDKAAQVEEALKTIVEFDASGERRA